MGRKKHSVNLMFTILLLGIFAMAAVFVAVLGAQVYAHSADRLQANFDTRTSIVYLSEKIRTAESLDSVSVRVMKDGSKALVVADEFEGIVYEAWMFVDDGQLCESVVSAGADVVPGAAQRIMGLGSLSAEITGDGVTLSVVTEDGHKASTFISRRAKG